MVSEWMMCLDSRSSRATSDDRLPCAGARREELTGWLASAVRRSAKASSAESLALSCQGGRASRVPIPPPVTLHPLSRDAASAGLISDHTQRW